MSKPVDREVNGLRFFAPRFCGACGASLRTGTARRPRPRGEANDPASEGAAGRERSAGYVNDYSNFIGGRNALDIRHRRCRLALGVLLGRVCFELEADERLVADDPRIVTGVDYVGVTWLELLLGAVFVDDVQAA
jgi:hypothetical protein